MNAKQLFDNMYIDFIFVTDDIQCTWDNFKLKLQKTLARMYHIWPLIN